MSIFYVSAWEKNATDADVPYWENSVNANDVEEAYVIGKSQFKTENPNIILNDYTIKASGYQVEK